MFTLVTHAYAVLSDPVRRARYDLEHGFVERTETSVSALHREQKQQAQKELRLMNVTYTSKRSSEEACNGVIITNAMYGAMKSYVNPRRSVEKAATGHLIDVTVQLQCAVESSTLYLEGGVCKTISCRGLYDPSEQPGRLGRHEPRLCVRYTFRGKLHQIVVSDQQELKIPMRAHQLSASQHNANKKGKRPRRSSRSERKRSASDRSQRKMMSCGGTLPPTQTDAAARVHVENPEEKHAAYDCHSVTSPKKEEERKEEEEEDAQISVTSSSNIFVASMVTVLAAGFLVYFFSRRRS